MSSQDQSGPHPTWADVLALVAQLDASGLADAELVADGVRVRVSRHALPSTSSVAAPQGPAASAAASAAPSSAARAPASEEALEPEAPGTLTITAPMLGVLYHKPAPDQPSFVTVGDRVEPDTTVAIIEVMKLMNPVSAGVSGVITQVCTSDAQMVEHGDVLFRVQGEA
jgi:acetyl-CoA carboxylase biotin carboxyl carrier protein